MTIKEIFELREQGRKEEAYEAARAIYSSDKSPYSSTAMFLTATDVLKIRVSEGRIEEANKICLALERLLSSLADEKGWMRNALDNCKALLEKGKARKKMSESGPEHIKTGIWGEDVAVAYLSDKGYIILERDWRSQHRDIDIIARKGDVIIFVEVKTRRNQDFTDPLQAINYQKRKNLCRAINHYIHYRKIEIPWRFDVISIVGKTGSSNPDINHIENFSLW